MYKMAVTLVLTDFNVDVTMDLSGTFATVAPQIGDYHVDTVNLPIKLTEWSSCFKITSDSLDVNNVDASDIQYFVYSPANVAGLASSHYDASNASGAGGANLVDGNPAMRAVVDGTGSIVDFQQFPIVASSPTPQLECDFIRHIAKTLFNTANGVDLFNNEVQLRASIETACGTGAGNLIHQIAAKLTASASASPMLNNASSSVNFTYTLLAQLFALAPGRFATYSGLSASVPTELKWEVGDVIQYVLTLNAADGQEDLVGSAAVAPRKYKINMVLSA